MPLEMKKDRLVKTWDELHTVLYGIKIDRHNRYRSDFVYRGVGDRNWHLDTSLQRLGSHYDTVEGPLLRNFLKYAGPDEVDSDALLYRLALAQHHGLPTRVLDWTTSPKVAAHFATWEEAHFEKDAAIWCVDVVQARELLPKNLRNKLHVEKAFLFSVEMLDEYKRLSEFDDLGGEFALFFEPPSLDGRIVNQAAILSIMPGAGLDMKKFLEKHDYLYERIIIPAKLKWELRDKLDQDNVTERMLFPGLDGTSRWLKRYYGAGPNGPDARVNVNADPNAPSVAGNSPTV
ncbi:FRG domain-containing protein [Bradyrhizobium sp. CCBAU 11386]|uniref:FRG domain-containing protein n=1 Tax=Bradyrhizobium sp. CCBAU 11386 TaxID=1630837 RepID=UPI0023047B21|nr:FRG domain-containing protein [Bradyrhizobium sp. CCBAU 11386]